MTTSLPPDTADCARIAEVSLHRHAVSRTNAHIPFLPLKSRSLRVRTVLVVVILEPGRSDAYRMRVLCPISRHFVTLVHANDMTFTLD